jgi:hypothetical protein
LRPVRASVIRETLDGVAVDGLGLGEAALCLENLGEAGARDDVIREALDCFLSDVTCLVQPFEVEQAHGGYGPPVGVPRIVASYEGGPLEGLFRIACSPTPGNCQPRADDRSCLLFVWQTALAHPEASSIGTASFSP